jgi:hypothetical protein
VSDIQTLLGFGCPDNATLALRLRDAEVPLFRYQYQGKRDPRLQVLYSTLLYTATTQNLFQRQDLRAFHGSEIPLIFGTYNHSGLVPTHREIFLSKLFKLHGCHSRGIRLTVWWILGGHGIARQVEGMHRLGMRKI